ncbi:MAG TPA: PLP-dependent aspartate aminotransferase family protein [Acidobacteriota bacterium]|nr:PLP-dependent aspartate aminotransferase family protein [Acidobacteriota bacterium]
MHLKTRLIHHPGAVCEHTGAVSPPIYQVSTFRQHGVNRHKGFEYSRGENPTRQVFEQYVADLEGGTRGFAFASGMAAISACFMLLKAGDHIVATEGLYGGTFRVLSRVFERFNLRYSFVDTNDIDAVNSAFRDETRMVYVETPSNPLMVITDIARISELAHSRKALVVVDNTFMSPYLQRPLELGADISVHSASKFLGGHSDVIAGVAVVKDQEVASRMKWVQVSVGGILGPLDSWLLVRGMKTLGVRLSHSQESAQAIATWLCGRPEVERVYYPGLATHPRAEIHREQADGGGAILSFSLRPTIDVEKFLTSLKVWSLAVSLGAVESIVTQPSRMTHASYPSELRERIGVTDQLVRLSVGLEDVDDLIGDLEEAFEKSQVDGRKP